MDNNNNVEKKWKLAQKCPPCMYQIYLFLGANLHKLVILFSENEKQLWFFFAIFQNKIN
jgi:hypothetical protein